MYKSFLPVTVSVMLSLASPLGMAKDAAATAAESVTQQDKANIEAVKAFAAAWNGPEHGADHLAPSFAVKLNAEGPTVTDRKSYLQGWSSFVPGSQVVVEYHGFYSRNPVVVTHHTDTIKTPGKPDYVLDLVGVFVIKDGKVTEWVDYPHK